MSSPHADSIQLHTRDEVIAFTRAAVTDAFTAETATRQAARDQLRLSMSGLGGCTRAAAYMVSGTDPSNVPPPEDGRMALLGTWIHEHLLPAMAARMGPDAVVEQPVELHAAGLVIPGSLDLATTTGVWDLKSVREWRLHGVRRRGTYSEHRIQVLGYALARYQAGYPVEWVSWLYIDRSTGEVHVEVEPFTNGAALAVVDRLETIRFHTARPDEAPRDGHGPGLSMACDHCHWLTRCYGPDAVPGEKGAQAYLAATPAGVEQALALYGQAAATASEAERDKEFAKLVLAKTPPGVYGAWELGRGTPGSTLDTDQIKTDYEEELGRPVPKKPTTGKIIVKPAPRQDG